MAYTVPHTIAGGELVTTATMNNEWGGNVSFLANPHSCRVYANANLSIPNFTSGDTILAFNSERYKTTTSMHSTVTNNSRLIAPIAGVYLITLDMEFATNGTGFRWGKIVLNNVTGIAYDSRNSASITFGVGFNLSTVWKMAASDYVDARVGQNSGSALNLTATVASSPEFSMTWLGLG